MSNKLVQQQNFVKELAQYLAGNEVRDSIDLQMGKESAREWSRLRGTTPLFGYYPEIVEAEAVLFEFLNIAPPPAEVKRAPQ